MTYNKNDRKKNNDDSENLKIDIIGITEQTKASMRIQVKLVKEVFKLTKQCNKLTEELSKIKQEMKKSGNAN